MQIPHFPCNGISPTWRKCLRIHKPEHQPGIVWGCPDCGQTYKAMENDKYYKRWTRMEPITETILACDACHLPMADRYYFRFFQIHSDTGKAPKGRDDRPMPINSWVVCEDCIPQLKLVIGSGEPLNTVC